jgi:hypothetical protein
VNTSIAKFMSIALTVVVISALLFLVGYRMVDTEVTGTGGYEEEITGVGIPQTQNAHGFTP